MNTKLLKRVNAAGYCCLFKLLYDFAWADTSMLAKALGVTPRCIRQRRKALYDGTLTCLQGTLPPAPCTRLSPYVIEVTQPLHVDAPETSRKATAASSHG